MAGAQATSTAADSGPRLQFAGEVGLRSEWIVNENFARSDDVRSDDVRMRWRTRVRLGGEYAPDQKVRIGFRLSTGSEAFPSSAWSSLSNDLRRHPLQLDRAYANLDWLKGVQLRVGLEANPLFAPTELLWDSDVQVAGIAEIAKLGPNLALTAGQFMLREIRSTRPDAEENSFLIANGLTWAARNESIGATIGVSHYHFTNPNTIARSLQRGDLDSEFRTNRIAPLGSDPSDVRFFSRFSILEFGVKMDHRRQPWGAVVELALNLRARRRPTLGPAFANKQRLAAGGSVRYGRNQNVRDWQVSAGFFRIEADSVIAVYNSDDLQQTNVNVVPVEFQVRLPGSARFVWDSYFQKKIDTTLPSNGGITHGENALKVRSRVSLVVTF